MKKFLVLLFVLLVTNVLAAPALPYDEQTDAQADINRALVQAGASRKKVLVIFGANWCPDCRQLDQALRGKSAALIDGKFIIVKVDVGRFDKHKEIAQAYGNPIKKGIPAAVVLSADNKVLYATTGGELADARRMGENGIYDFFSRHIALP